MFVPQHQPQPKPIDEGNMKGKVYPDTYELEPDIFGGIEASEEFRRAVDTAIGGNKSREVSSSKAAVDNSAVGGWGTKMRGGARDGGGDGGGGDEGGNGDEMEM
jgi:hypothetical protein